MSTASRETLRFDQVEVGDRLPELDVKLTTTLIVAGALASRDYQEVHHDADLARERGTPNIFMNILTTNGWVGRFVTDWAGPEALIRKVSIRLGVPNYPGDTMRMRGEVTEKTTQDGEGRVQVRVVGSNGLGDHVVGNVALTLPTGS